MTVKNYIELVFGFVVAVATAFACVFAYDAKESANQSAEAAKESNGISKTAFVVANRPWLSVRPRFSDVPDLPPKFFKDEPPYVPFPTSLEIENVGHLPAQYVTIGTDSFVQEIDPMNEIPAPIKRSDFDKKMQATCTNGRPIGRSVLPGETIKSDHGLWGMALQTRKRSALFLIVCIQYKTGMDAMDNMIHRTPALYSVNQIDGMGELPPPDKLIPSKYYELLGAREATGLEDASFTDWLMAN